ncbi:MAG: oligoribonuclease [Thiotrichales bacterium]|nr:MAG: oligoribonuclease [Thiotrichales bacterium]
MSKTSTQHLIWIDLEMTGLDPNTDRIIEIAMVVTDTNLNIIAESPAIAISQPEYLIESMDKWNTKHHNESGLVKRLMETKTTEAIAEEKFINFAAKYVKAGKTPLCGSSIHHDRRFLRKYMPKLDAFFHYRIIDVSTLKELVKYWYPTSIEDFKKQNKHQALDDIKESISELLYYKNAIENITNTKV